MHRSLRGADAGLALVLVAVVRGYQLLLSPLLGPVCRYAPSCSAYAAQALRVHGGVRGTVLSARRLQRCHPWAAGGWDPVPEPGDSRRDRRPAPPPVHTGHRTGPRRGHRHCTPDPARTL